MRSLFGAGLALTCALAQAQTTVPEKSITPDVPTAEKAEKAEERQPAREYGRLDFKVNPETYSIVSNVRGLSTHKPTYIYPLSYSPQFNERQSELLFQISAKQRLFGSNAYLAYTQKSFWQLLNSEDSSRFRETNYDAEIFYRWIPDDPKPLNHWGADIGFEHESNGREVPFSRSWNRVYLGAFHPKGRHLAYLKFWYRIPEKNKAVATDPRGDDNPDINRFMGYSELSYSRQIYAKQLLTGMVRGNPETNKGAVSFTWSIPSTEGYVFYGVSVFHGYGESLSLYDRSVTRVMLGALLAR